MAVIGKIVTTGTPKMTGIPRCTRSIRKSKERRMSLGLPLALVSVGVAASLLVGKKVHIGFGIAWGVLSVLHGMQHYKKMQQDARRMLDLKNR